MHRALRELVAEGLIERRRGSGSYVGGSPPISNLLDVRDIDKEITERGHRHTTRVCSVSREKAIAELAAVMRLRNGTPVFRCRLVHLENGVPIQ